MDPGQRWAPSGSRRLVYNVQDFNISDARPCHDRVEVLDLATGSRTRVRCAAESPSWSPKGGRLLLARHVFNTADYDLVRVDLGSGQGTLLVPHTRTWLAATAPDWRPRVADCRNCGNLHTGACNVPGRGN